MGGHRCHDLLVAVAILLFAIPSSDGRSGIFVPGDTRIFSYSTTFCQSLTLRSNSSEYPVTLYLLRGKPKLTLQDNFTLNLNTTFGYIDKKFHLNTGSHFTMQYCLKQPFNQSITFSFRSWELGNIRQFPVENSCGHGKKMYNYMITSSDEYYCAFTNHGAAVPDITMQFLGTNYNVTESETAENCTAFSNSSCSVDVPFESDYTAMFTVSVSPWGPDNFNPLYIEWDCGPRVWVYAVIACASLITCTSMTTITFACCWREIRRRRKNWPLIGQYAPLKSVSPSQSPSSNINSLPHTHGYGATLGHKGSPLSSKADSINLLRPPHLEVLDPAPVRREGSVVLSESAVIAGAAVLL